MRRACIAGLLAVMAASPPDKGGLPLKKVDVTEPKQTALIAFDGTTQVLYISSILRPSQKTRLLEILPLPGEPTAELADPKVIERAAGVYNARVQKQLDERAKARRRENLRALICTGVFALLVCISVIHFLRRRRYLSMLVSVVLLGIAWMMTVPTFLAAQRSGFAATTVEILSQQKLGPHALRIVKTREPGDISKWVEELFQKEGGDPAAFDQGWKDLLESYVRNGCLYFAVDLIDADPASGPIAPIRYTFATKEPWFPLRISSRGRGSSEILLMVLVPRDSRLKPSYEALREASMQMRMGFDLSESEVRSIDPVLVDRLKSCSPRLHAVQFASALEELKHDFVLRSVE
ncbi:MAG TPA: DUF2330 domain-containing protein [Planctomycetota bacterium]|nr:DUF2330 domain-containing protein [Planctomycetota bacterium]